MRTSETKCCYAIYPDIFPVSGRHGGVCLWVWSILAAICWRIISWFYREIRFERLAVGFFFFFVSMRILKMKLSVMLPQTFFGIGSDCACMHETACRENACVLPQFHLASVSWYLPWNTQSTGSDITSNLEVVQTVYSLWGTTLIIAPIETHS